MCLRHLWMVPYCTAKINANSYLLIHWSVKNSSWRIFSKTAALWHFRANWWISGIFFSFRFVGVFKKSHLKVSFVLDFLHEQFTILNNIIQTYCMFCLSLNLIFCISIISWKKFVFWFSKSIFFSSLKKWMQMSK